MRVTADSMRIDDDEGRFLLVIETDEGDRIEVDFHSVALEFEAEARKALRPYALEAEHARQSVARGETLAEYLGHPEGEAYSTDDPKHPLYHGLMSTLYDNRKGK
jgi:hypothetical protein